MKKKGRNIPHNQLFARKIKIEHCLMHWTVVKVLHPMSGNYSRVGETDLSIVWLLINKVKVKWPCYIVKKKLLCEEMSNSKTHGV